MVFSITALESRADEVLQGAAEVFGALSTPTSLRIVRALVNGPQSAAQLMVATGASRSGVAYHLQQLHGAGLVGKQGRGPQTRYVLVPGTVTLACTEAMKMLDAVETMVAPLPALPH